MSVFTVHEPRRRGDAEPNLERFEFVPERFHFWAFVLGPLWMLWHRIWLWLLLYLIALAGVLIGLRMLGAGTGLQLLALLLLAILVGLEAPALRRWALSRRGWTMVGVVAAADRDSAERRYFDSWAGAAALPPPVRQPVAPVLHGSVHPQQSTVVGLFPEPGGPR
jgi:hypothetical protein